jgi:hypothetical protein
MYITKLGTGSVALELEIRVQVPPWHIFFESMSHSYVRCI